MSEHNELESRSAQPNRRTLIQTGAGALATFALAPSLIARPRPTREIPLILVGLGRQGRSILGEIQKLEGGKVVAVVDEMAKRLSSGLRRARGAEGYATLAEALEKHPEAEGVIVATGTPRHREVAVPALEAKKNVYCEAPLATTVEDCQAIARAARQAGTVFQAGFQGRANPVYKLARGFARSGSLGELASMRAQHSQKISWITPASDAAYEKALNWRIDPERTIGLAGEFGAQQFDVAHWFFGRYPVAVRGSGSVRLHRDGRQVHDTVHCDLRFEDGVHFQYNSTIANSYEGTYELFQGSNSAIKLGWSHGWMFKEADATTQGWEVYANRQQFHNDQGITLIADATQLAAQDKLQDGVGLPFSSLYYALEAFLESVADGYPVPCDAMEGLRATVVGIHAHRATLEGTEIEIDPKLLEDV